MLSTRLISFDRRLMACGVLDEVMYVLQYGDTAHVRTLALAFVKEVRESGAVQ